MLLTFHVRLFSLHVYSNMRRCRSSLICMFHMLTVSPIRRLTGCLHLTRTSHSSEDRTFGSRSTRRQQTSACRRVNPAHSQLINSDVHSSAAIVNSTTSQKTSRKICRLLPATRHQLHQEHVFETCDVDNDIRIYCQCVRVDSDVDGWQCRLNITVSCLCTSCCNVLI